MNDLQRIIHGKSNQTRIINLEVVDDHAELYLLNDDGSVSIKHVSNKYFSIKMAII